MGFSYTTTGQEEASSLVPIGEYDVTIIKATEKISQRSGKDMIELEIDTGKGHLWEYIVDGFEKTGAKIREILESCGKYRPGMPVNAATFRNLRGRIKVKHKTQDGEVKACIDWLKPQETTAPAVKQPVDTDGIPF